MGEELGESGRIWRSQEGVGGGIWEVGGVSQESGEESGQSGGSWGSQANQATLELGQGTIVQALKVVPFLWQLGIFTLLLRRLFIPVLTFSAYALTIRSCASGSINLAEDVRPLHLGYHVVDEPRSSRSSVSSLIY